MGSGMLSGDVTSSSHLEAAVRLSEVSIPASRASDSRHWSKRAPVSSRKARSTREQGRSNKLAMCTNQAVVVALLPDAVALVVAAAVVAVVAVVEGNNDRPTDRSRRLRRKCWTMRCRMFIPYEFGTKSRGSWESFFLGAIHHCLFFILSVPAGEAKSEFLFLLALQYRLFFFFNCCYYYY